MTVVKVYGVYGKYYNPTIDVYTEKVLGYYFSRSKALQMCQELSSMNKDGSKYWVESIDVYE